MITRSPAPVPPFDPAEIPALAAELAATYCGMVEHFRRELGLEPSAAVAYVDRLQGPGPNPEYAEQLRHGPPEQASWWQLNALHVADPEAALRRWADIKAAACQERATGTTAAKAVEGFEHRPWDRAQFFAIRQALMQDWHPQNGIEQTLIDTMAQSQFYFERWLGVLANWESLESKRQETEQARDRHWEPPRLSTAETLDQAAAMADRFNRLFLRTLRQLRDLRRYAPAVTIQSAGQVNIGGQQVNVASAGNTAPPVAVVEG